ncbi:MAG: HEAT repeat domain-containing protein [Phycisphaerae bacterium]|nr:HEAT repeat domain-containing protein [Gemmatimonadaceae bacterium]
MTGTLRTLYGDADSRGELDDAADLVDRVDPVAISAISEALRALAKSLRANQLYLPNNPTRQRATEIAQSLFTQVWYHTDAVRLEISEHELLWQKQSVYRDAERGSESLPFVFYRDGLRELELLPGFELDELPVLLALLQRAKSAAPDEDDLVTLLWVADLSTVKYRHVEVGGDVDLPVMLAGGSGIATFTSGGPQLAVPGAESGSPGDGPPPGIVRMEDFETTLYFLEPRELAYLKDEVQREFRHDGKRDVLGVLFDIIETQDGNDTHHEAIEVLNNWLIELIAAADYELVAFLLQEAGDTVLRNNALTASTRDALKAISTRLSEPAVMSQLLQALDENTRAPVASTLEALFGHLHASALRVLLSWMASAPLSPARAAVERAAAHLAASNTGELVRQLESDDLTVVQGALRLATRLKSPAAVPGLSKVLRSDDASVRGEVVSALAEIATPGAMQVLERAINDADRDVRVAALRAIATNRYANALPNLLIGIKRKDLQQTDLSEKVALFESYGLLCGDAGVPLLDGMLNGKSLLRFRECSEVRGCAARALGLVGTPNAMASLQRAANSKDLVVRTAVQRAVRGSA